MFIVPATNGDDGYTAAMPDDLIYDGLGGTDTLTLNVNAPLMTISGDAAAASIFALEADSAANLRLSAELTSVERIVVNAGLGALIDGSSSALALELAGRGMLIGGSNGDILTAIAGTGATTLQGGAGNDRFIVAGSSAAAPVFITDLAIGDVLVMPGYAPAPGATPVAITVRRSKGQTILEAGGQTVVLTNGGYRMQIDDLGQISIRSVVSTTVTAKATEAADSFVGTAADDIIVGKGGDDSIFGGSGNDRLFGDAGNDYLSGGAGDDLLNGGSGANKLFGGAGNDKLVGGADADLLIGGDDDDELFGEAGDDVLQGDDGADQLNGGAGNDRIGGGAGDDRLYGADGDDRLSGGDGNDTLNGGSGADTLNGGAGDDLLRGDDGDDRLIGGDGNDDLQGGIGNDRLSGGAGIDFLDGGDGDDRIEGGMDGDVLTGGAGADRFIFLEGSTSMSFLGATRVTDFDATEGDSVNLRDIDANILTAGVDDKFAWLGTDAFTGTAGELRLQLNSDGIAFLQGDRDGDGMTDFTIRFDAPVGLDLPGAILV